MRAFSSVVLPLKAVLLNLLSLAVALGVIVFVVQQGHGSKAIWGLQATDAIIAWIPLMIFTFPLRALDGLRGVPARAEARGLRRVGDTGNP
jgi:uncharacterized membrane protein YdfJ with MMPL/SSD domain